MWLKGILLHFSFSSAHLHPSVFLRFILQTGVRTGAVTALLNIVSRHATLPFSQRHQSVNDWRGRDLGGIIGCTSRPRETAMDCSELESSAIRRYRLFSLRRQSKNNAACQSRRDERRIKQTRLREPQTDSSAERRDSSTALCSNYTSV